MMLHNGDESTQACDRAAASIHCCMACIQAGFLFNDHCLLVASTLNVNVLVTNYAPPLHPAYLRLHEYYTHDCILLSIWALCHMWTFVQHAIHYWVAIGLWCPAHGCTAPRSISACVCGGITRMLLLVACVLRASRRVKSAVSCPTGRVCFHATSMPGHRDVPECTPQCGQHFSFAQSAGSTLTSSTLKPVERAATTESAHLPKCGL